MLHDAMISAYISFPLQTLAQIEPKASALLLVQVYQDSRSTGISALARLQIIILLIWRTHTHTPSVFSRPFFLQVNSSFIEPVLFSHPYPSFPVLAFCSDTSQAATSCCCFFFRKPRDKKSTLRQALWRSPLAVLAVAVRSSRSYHLSHPR